MAAQTQSPAPTPKSAEQPAPIQVVENETAQPEIGFVSQKPVTPSEAAPKPAPPSDENEKSALETVEKTAAAPHSVLQDTSGGLKNVA